jgi:arylsulfatase A-like enzyme
MVHGATRRSAQTDKPIAGLIRDLKQRGVLDSTLVVWTSEFGRTPWSQNTTGRDHNPKGFTSWLAGGGVKGGTVFGSTDEVGYKTVENPVYINDLQATILQQMGLDYKKMEVEINGRPGSGSVGRVRRKSSGEFGVRDLPAARSRGREQSDWGHFGDELVGYPVGRRILRLLEGLHSVGEA